MSVSSYLKRKKAKANLAKAKRAAKRLDRETRKKFKFSGKVEKSFKGTPEQTKYFVKGKTVATVQHGAEPTAQVSKQADIKFQRQGESVAIRRTGISTSQIQAARQRPPITQPSVQQPVALEKPQPEPKPSFTGYREKKEIEQRVKAYEERTKGFARDEAGTIIVPEKEYGSIEKDYQEIIKLKTLYSKAPLVKIKEKVSKVINPFPSYVAIGGTFQKREDIEKLSPATQRLVFAAQPEVILASTRFPTIKDVGVKFAGVKTATKEGKQVTGLKFQTTTGERGQAIGVSKVVGAKGDYTFGKTYVVGAKGRSVIDLTKSEYKMILRDTQKFGVVEETITLGKGDKFVQVSAGKVGIQKQVVPFRSADFGIIKEDITSIFGKTITPKGDIYSMGKIVDLSKVTQPSGIGYIVPSGTGATSFATTFQSTQSVTATQAAVRAAVGGIQKGITTPIIPGVTQTAVISSPITIEKIEVPALKSLPFIKSKQAQVPVTGIATIQGTSARQKSKQIQRVAQVPSTAQVEVLQQQQQQKLSLKTPLLQVQPLRAMIPTTPITPQTPKPITLYPFLSSKKSLPKTKIGRYSIFGRRFGKFKVVGVSPTEKGAFSMGKDWASKTLGVTFKIPKAKARKLTGFRTKVTKKAVLYIEPGKRRLKKRGKSLEVKEIEFWKKIKKKKKKSKGSKKK